MSRGLVLVLASDKVFALERIRALGFEPICLTTPAYERLYQGRFQTYTVPSMEDLTGLVSRTRSLLDDHVIGHIVGLSEKTIFPASLLRTMFGFPGLQVEAGLRFTNKLAMKTALKEAGVPVVPFLRLDCFSLLVEACERVGLPVVVKPVCGSGSKNTLMLRDRPSLDSFIASGLFRSYETAQGSWLVESMVTDLEEYHVDAIMDGGQSVWRLASRYFLPVVQSRNSFGGSVHLSPDHPVCPILFRLCDDCCRALGLARGVVHLEVLRQGNRFWVGEIACRPAGAGIPASLQRFFGIDLWDAYLKLALSLPLTPPLPEARRRDAAGWVKLPLKQGTITRLSSKEELLALPHAVQVDELVALGDRVDLSTSAFSSSGFVLLEAADPDEIVEGFEAIHSAFRLETTVERG